VREVGLSFRFVHAADIHLDSPLRSLALRDGDLAELIGNATRKAFTAIVDLCLDEQVDALLLSGDLYDGEQTSMKTARFLSDQIAKLHQAGIQVFIIRGNHDALSKITKELTFPDGTVKIFGARAIPISVERAPGALPITIHGISFAEPRAPESLLSKFRPPVEGAINIGLLHTSLGGTEGHDVYAPCDLGDLQRAGFRYWALGHIHKRFAAEGAATIVMPGIPQGRDIGEAGAKSVTLVAVDDEGSICIEERRTSVAQFERVTVDLGGCEDWRDMLGLLEASLGQTRDGVESEHLVARLRVTGSTGLAWRLRRDLELFREEAVSRAAGIGRTWIDKIEVECRPPAIALSGSDSAAPLDELRGLMGELPGNDAYRAEITRIAEELRAQLPPECRGALGTDAETFASLLNAVMQGGIDDALARFMPAPNLDKTDAT
jgi:exonuclease SbcD